ncbi:hypothetical protein DRJ16_02900 [Candidatus Woesearchaeota archaeon]|nr:MAG: hypothetical protein DRJ16_02900 [Candidatus Woesearchaeota archaeon]
MTGREFAKFRRSIGRTLVQMAPILGFKSKQSLDYQEGLDKVAIVLELFYNYSQRYGAEEAEIEFKRKFRKKS